MLSLKASDKRQFERVFPTSDWQLFKEVADISFSEAAFLKKSDFNRIPDSKRLLVRNSRKRLLIGVGAESALKAVYLKTGHCINKPQSRTSQLKVPFTPAAAAGVPLNGADTYTLGQLIDPLSGIIVLQHPTVVTEDLKIAKVFRNKEGHVVTAAHRFERQSFRAIEAALVELYEIAFRERLVVRFSLEPGEKATWKTTPLT